MAVVKSLLSAPYQLLSDPKERWRVDVVADQEGQSITTTVLFPDGDGGRHQAKQLHVGDLLT